MRKQRKMGHITVVGPSMDIVKSRIKSIIDGGSQAEIFGNKSTWYLGSSTKTSRRDWAVRSGNGNSGSLSLAPPHTQTRTQPTHTLGVLVMA